MMRLATTRIPPSSPRSWMQARTPRRRTRLAGRPDRGEFWWNERKPDEPVLFDSKIRLGEDFFNEIIRHPVPIEEHGFEHDSLGQLHSKYINLQGARTCK